MAEPAQHGAWAGTEAEDSGAWISPARSCSSVVVERTVRTLYEYAHSSPRRAQQRRRGRGRATFETARTSCGVKNQPLACPLVRRAGTEGALGMLRNARWYVHVLRPSAQQPRCVLEGRAELWVGRVRPANKSTETRSPRHLWPRRDSTAHHKAMQSTTSTLVLLQATVAAAFSYHPLPRAHAAVPMRHRAITAIAPLEGFDIPADAFDAPPPAAL